MILLPTIFLLIHGSAGQNIHLYIKRQFDEFRQSVANGTFSISGNRRLPSSSAMFALTEDIQLNFVALANAYNCIKPRNPYGTEGGSINFFSVSNTSRILLDEDIVNEAFARWKREPFSYGLRDDVIYNNINMQNFANMIFYQSTKYGCSTRTCFGPPVTYAFACVFDKQPVLNAPLYMVSRYVNGCTSNRDCQRALPFSRCNVITRLCSATNDTNFINFQRPTTTAKLTTVKRTTTVKSTTKAPSTVAREMPVTTPTILSRTTTTKTMTPRITPTTTTTTTTATATTTTASMPTTATTTPSSPGIITEEIRLKIINMHNYRRSRLAQGLVPNGKTGGNLPAGSNIFRMTYSMELERGAQAYASTCPSEGSTSLTNMGENFASIPSNTMAVYDCVISAIKSFWSQIRTESINPKVMFTEKLMMRSNGPHKFTQMAWATTHEVGCGAQRCGTNTVVVCRYSPRGNIVNESIYKQGQMCSTCPYGGCITDSRQQGLCPTFTFN